MDIPSLQELLQFLCVSDLNELSRTNKFISELVSTDQLWRLLYKRDFHTDPQRCDKYSIRQQYQLRQTSIFTTIDRAKTLNNVKQGLTLEFIASIHVIDQEYHGTTDHTRKFAVYNTHDWHLDLSFRCNPSSPLLTYFQHVNGFSQFWDNRNLTIELTYSSNGWYGCNILHIPWIGFATRGTRMKNTVFIGWLMQRIF